MKKRTTRRPPARHDQAAAGEPESLRIIGGKFRRHRLEYVPDRRTRPMKDRAREAIYNLVGPSVRGTHVFDLFAGTGAMGLEAISRGAARATFIEQHRPTAAMIRRNVDSIFAADRCEVVPASAFYVVDQGLTGEPALPWLVICCPPYDFYVDKADDMQRLIERAIADAPPASTIVVEADRRFDPELLPRADEWDVRAYPPAVVGILRTAAADVPGSAQPPAEAEEPS